MIRKRRRMGCMLALVLTLALSLTSCSRDNVSIESPDINEVLTTWDNDFPEVVCAYSIVDEFPADLKMVEDAINKITIPTINVRITLRPVPMADSYTFLTYARTIGEKIDIVCTFAGSSLNEESAYELTDFLNADGRGIKETVDSRFIDAISVNKKIFALPTINGKAVSTQIAFRKDIIDKHNIDTEFLNMENDFSRVMEMLRGIEDIYQKIKSEEPDIYPVVIGYPTSLLHLIRYDGLGNDIGVILGDDNRNIVNLYESNEFLSLITIMRDWYKKGYFMPETGISPESSTSLIKNGRAFSTFERSEIGFDVQLKTSTGYEMQCIKLVPPLLTTSDFHSFVWMVPRTATEPEAAMEFLNLMYTNKEIVNLLCFGIEGTHYQIRQDGTIEYPDGIDALNTTYSHAQYWEFGNTLLGHVLSGNPPDYNVQLQKNNENAPVSLALGFSFDATEVQVETAAIWQITGKYLPGLLTGALDETAYPSFLEELKEAGIDRIIVEKQRQYDLWLGNDIS